VVEWGSLGKQESCHILLDRNTTLKREAIN